MRSRRNLLRLPSTASRRCEGVASCVHWFGPGRFQPPLVAITRPAWVRKQRFGNQFLAYVWPVGVRGIDEIDIKLRSSAKNRQSCLAIFRRPPDAFAGKAHCPEAETMHGNFPAERNITSQTCRKFFLVHDRPPIFLF